jgi:methionine-S-sulfoxide reductase
MRKSTKGFLLAMGFTVLLLAGCTTSSIQNQASTFPAQGESVMSSNNNTEGKPVATFAAGCFWGVEHKFRQLPGVISSMVGYTGGEKENPTYLQVCRGGTGHAEAVRVIYNPAEISYSNLLDAFFRFHDPTQENRQGPDIGKQYRSAIYYHSPEQKAAAEKKIKELNESGRFNKPVATELVSSEEFYKAEEYHQKYYDKQIKK